jgi:hypothetical protein
VLKPDKDIVDVIMLQLAYSAVICQSSGNSDWEGSQIADPPLLCLKLQTAGKNGDLVLMLEPQWAGWDDKIGPR